jgi:hypothetical protein
VIKIFMLLFLTLPIFADESFNLIEDSLEIEKTKRRDGEFNPILTTALSLIPGGGQLYTGHFTRSGLFLGTETILGFRGLEGWKDYRKSIDENKISLTNYNKSIKTYDDSIIIYNYKIDSLIEFNNKLDLIDYNLPEFDTTSYEIEILKAKNSYQLSKYDILNQKLRYFYNPTIWFGGIGIWNLIDGYGVSNHFKGSRDSVRVPKKAALLSAIPFSGAGQVYNGKLFKAGLVSTVQIGCLLSAINFNTLMNEAEDMYLELSEDSLYKYSPDLSSERSAWKNKYKTAAGYRTTFIWYGVIFYFYGVFDGLADAHLHKFDDKFDITAEFNPIENEITGQFSLYF